MITPKNWESFQHYADRRPAWIKLHRGLLDDYEFSRLPVASRALAPLLWLLASEYDGGSIPCSLEELAFRLRMSVKELQIALNPLIDGGFFISDSTVLAGCKQGASPEKRRDTSIEEKESCAVPTGTRTLESHFEEFWKIKPGRGSAANPRAPALKAYERAVKSGADPTAINAAARVWASADTEAVGTKFTPTAAVWLNQRRFEDYQSRPEDAAKIVENEEFMKRRGYAWLNNKWIKTEETNGQDQGTAGGIPARSETG